MIYDWQAALVFVATLVVLTTIGSKLVLRVPAFQRMRTLNREADRPKLARQRFKDAVKINSRIGVGTNLVFYATIPPFCVNLEARPIWVYAVQIVAVLMLFDFHESITSLIFGPARSMTWLLLVICKRNETSQEEGENNDDRIHRNPSSNDFIHGQPCRLRQISIHNPLKPL